MFSVRDFSDRAMALRKLCRDMKKLPLKDLFFFPDKNLTGIAPTKLIVKKDSDDDESKLAGKKSPHLNIGLEW